MTLSIKKLINERPLYWLTMLPCVNNVVAKMLLNDSVLTIALLALDRVMGKLWLSPKTSKANYSIHSIYGMLLQYKYSNKKTT